ncbi:MAG: hypothetical protein JWQ09_122 [Segetibacter sp.]|nr:hypothetical protein [Segetibacter sp.]
MICYPKGSEWRKWDLHVHTPKSLHQNYGGDTPEVWEKYISDLEALPEEFKVLGINDYLFLDGYAEVLKYKRKGRLANLDLILPIIELRIKMFGNLSNTDPWKRINLHLIFSDALSPDVIKAQFIDAIQTCYYLIPEHRDFWGGVINRDSLIDFGNNIIKSSTVPITDSPIKVGFNSLNFDETEVIKKLEGCHLFNGKYFKAIGKGEWDALRWDGSIADKKSIINKCDFVFTSANDIASYQKSRSKLKAEGIKDLLIDCSDAHSFSSDVLMKDRISNCFTWIKADPTFDGLKQVKFEPETRLRIQNDKPEEKKKYVVIDKVRFITDQTKDQFSDSFIEINDKLNCIIGGKSSGKSLLLYYIAKTIDPDQVVAKFRELEIGSEYDFDKNPDFNFEVVWKDGTTYKLNEPSETKNRQITYIPQMYINYLAEKRGKSELKNLVQSILEEKGSFKKLWTDKSEAIADAKLKLNNTVTVYFQTKEQVSQVEREIKNRGDKQARILNIEEKNTELATLRSESGISDEQEQVYKQLVDTRSTHTRRLELLNLLLTTFEIDYPAELRRINTSIKDGLSSYAVTSIAKFSNYLKVANRLREYYTNDQDKISNVINSLVAESLSKVEKIKRLISLSNQKIEFYKQQLEPFFKKIKNQEKVQQLQKQIEDEQAIVTQINELETTRNGFIKKEKEEYHNILLAYSALYSLYNEVVEVVNTTPDYNNISPEKQIELKALLEFDSNRFAGSCTNFINKQSYLDTTFGDFFKSNVYVFDKEKHLENFRSIFNTILTDEIKYNLGGNTQNVTRGLFDDYFNINYELSQKGENILKMSPGKKGLILLFLMLHLSNADYPILIDQPEDNLDNRTVYTELKDFIKEKKIERQILIVTHNANLVVPTDSEDVIVANQSGQDASKENEKYQFEYITGALENSFPLCTANGILNQMGIKEHVCDILEGGTEAFMEREKRYDL